MNQNSNRIIVAPITSNVKKIYSFEYGIINNEITGKIMMDQIRSIDKVRFGKKVGNLSIKEIEELKPILFRVNFKESFYWSMPLPKENH